MVEKRRLSQPARFSRARSELEDVDVEFWSWRSRSLTVAVIASNQLNVVVSQALLLDMVSLRAQNTLVPTNRV